MSSKARKDIAFVVAILVVLLSVGALLWSGAKAANDRSQLVQTLRTEATITNANTAQTKAYIQELDARLNAVVRFVAEHPGKKIPADLLTLITAPKLIPLPSSLTPPRTEARARSKSHGKEKHK